VAAEYLIIPCLAIVFNEFLPCETKTEEKFFIHLGCGEFA
jgi:hypothetical protein